MRNYKASMEILLRNDELINETIYEYQRLADAFFKEWVILYGEEAITNYAHLIGSAHIGEYLIHWKRWEAFNSLFKSFFIKTPSPRRRRSSILKRPREADDDNRTQEQVSISNETLDHERKHTMRMENNVKFTTPATHQNNNKQHVSRSHQATADSPFVSEILHAGFLRCDGRIPFGTRIV